MRLDMKRSRERNSVSWATGGNLRQVKLVLAQESPSEVTDERLQGQLKSSGMLCPPKVGGVLSHCHVKSSGMQPSNGMESHAHFPGVNGYPNVCDLSFCIPQIKWKCPPEFILCHNWHVVAGEESLERDAQKLREMRLVEAVYPRLSQIPPTPSVSLDIEDQHYDDSLTPVVPLIVIEEEEEATVVPSDLVAPLNTSTSDHLSGRPQCLSSPGTHNTPAFEPAANQKPSYGLLHDVGEKCYPNTLPACQKPSCETLPALDIPAPELLTDLFTAAEAAVTAFVKSNEEGSMIDTNLLIKIFSDPIMIEQLMKENGAPSGTSTPMLSSKPLPGLVSASYPKPEMVLSPMPATRSSHDVHVRPTVTRMSPQPQLRPTVTRMSPQPQLRPTVTRMSSQPQLRPTVTRMSSQPQLQPTVTRTSPQLGHMPVAGVDFGVKEVTPSAPLVGPELSRVVPPYPSIGMEIRNMFLRPNRMQPNLPAMPVQAGSFPVTSFADMNPVPLRRPPVQLNGVPVPSFVAMQNNQVKNIDCIKNLIREHGVQREEHQVRQIPPYNANHHNHIHNLEREFKPKIQKPCTFFKSSRGCRNGASCPFLHETCSNILDAPNPKRMKLGLGEM